MGDLINLYDPTRRGKNKGFSRLFLIIVVALISAGLTGGGVWYWKQGERKKIEDSYIKMPITKPKVSSTPSSSPSPIPSPTPSLLLPSSTPPPIIDETANWKTYSVTLDWFGMISVKYPNDWSVIESTSSGHPNLVTFFNTNKSSCVKMSVSSDQASLDQELKNGATNWDASKQDNIVINSTSLMVNGQQAKKRAVSRDGTYFMDGAIYLGNDSRFSDNKVYAYLSSCGMNEADIFNSVMTTVKAATK